MDHPRRGTTALFSRTIKRIVRLRTVDRPGGEASSCAAVFIALAPLVHYPSSVPVLARGVGRITARQRSEGRAGVQSNIQESRPPFGIMANSATLQCDGCGQIASPDHVTRRVQRLEWATRYRPVHIHTLLLGAFSPKEERDFLYLPEGEFQGEAAFLLDAVGISTAGKTREAVHVEFQRAGFFLTYLLECPLNDDSQGKPQAESPLFLLQRLPVVT